MLFQINWEVYADRKEECHEIFSMMTPADDAKDSGEGIRVIGRWHVLGGNRGTCICETNDEEALNSWVLNWKSMCDIEVITVVTDESFRKTLNSKRSSGTSE